MRYIKIPYRLISTEATRITFFSNRHQKTYRFRKALFCFKQPFQNNPILVTWPCKAETTATSISVGWIQMNYTNVMPPIPVAFTYGKNAIQLLEFPYQFNSHREKWHHGNQCKYKRLCWKVNSLFMTTAHVHSHYCYRVSFARASM